MFRYEEEMWHNGIFGEDTPHKLHVNVLFLLWPCVLQKNII